MIEMQIRAYFKLKFQTFLSPFMRALVAIGLRLRFLVNFFLVHSPLCRDVSCHHDFISNDLFEKCVCILHIAV